MENIPRKGKNVPDVNCANCPHLLKILAMKNYIAIISLYLFSAASSAQSLNWSTLNIGTSENINDMYFQSPDTGYIVGDNYLFKKTTDGGITWTNLTAPLIGEKPGNNGKLIGIDFHRSFSFSNLNPGLYLTWEKGYHGVSTNDDGLTYSIYSYFDSTQFCSIKGISILPFNRGNGYVNLYTYGENCNGDAVFHNYFDGPFGFPSSDTFSSTGLAHFTTVDSDSFSSIFGHSDGYLLKYQNPFAVPDSIFLDPSGISAVTYAGNNKWYAYTNQSFGNMYVSIDSGKTFNTDTSFNPSVFLAPSISEFSFLSNGIGIGGGRMYANKGTIVIKDSSNWVLHVAQHPINTVKLFGNGTAFAAGDSGLFMTTTIATSISQIDQIELSFIVYPNPAKQSIYLKGLEEVDIDSIQLYDLNGKLIQNYSVQKRKLDISLATPGVYFLQVVIGGKQYAKKLLVK